MFFVHRLLIEAGRDFDAGLTIIFGLAILEFFWSMSDVGWAVLLTDITTPSSLGKIVGSLNFVLIIIILGAASVNQIFFLYIKLPDGLNASDYEMSLIISAWTIGA